MTDVIRIDSMSREKIEETLQKITGAEPGAEPAVIFSRVTACHLLELLLSDMDIMTALHKVIADQTRQIQDLKNTEVRLRKGLGFAAPLKISHEMWRDHNATGDVVAPVDSLGMRIIGVVEKKR